MKPDPQESQVQIVFDPRMSVDEQARYLERLEELVKEAGGRISYRHDTQSPEDSRRSKNSDIVLRLYFDPRLPEERQTLYQRRLQELVNEAGGEYSLQDPD